MTIVTTILAFLLTQSPVSSDLAEARETYDLEAAIEIADSLAAVHDETPTNEFILEAAEADLLVAELLRIEFEMTPEDEREARRELGDRIDSAAQRGLDRIDSLEESSRVLRVRADLIATLIRSKFRGQKYRRSMNQAARRAIELDPSNASAWVTLAKPPAFKPGRDDADRAEALEMLDEALTLDPDHETARVMRGRMLYELGDEAAARSEWSSVLKQNPRCRPARDLLEDPS